MTANSNPEEDYDPSLDDAGEDFSYDEDAGENFADEESWDEN